MITLGINYNKTHDSAACIVRDGEVVFAVAEERLSRIKHDASFPQMAIRACLDFANVRTDQLDEVCFGWTRAGAGFRHDLKCLATGGLPLTYLNDALRKISFDGASLWDVRIDILVLLLWGVIIYAIAGKVFKWE